MAKVRCHAFQNFVSIGVFCAEIAGNISSSLNLRMQRSHQRRAALSCLSN